MTYFHIAWTLTLLIVFVGIFIWAWSGRRKKDFDEAANLALDHDGLTTSDKAKN